MAPKNFIVVFPIFLLIFAFATLTIYRLYFLLPPDLEPKPPPSDLEALTFSSLSKEESEVMRKGGVEAAELATKIDSWKEIEAGSQEEIEIRAATIWAIEQMKKVLAPRFPQITARQLDDHLWSLGQAKSPEDKPYHRTRTIFY